MNQFFNDDKNPSVADTVALLAAVVAVSFSAIFIRLSSAPPLIIAAYRLGITVLLIAVPVLVLKGRELCSLKLKDLALGAVGGLFLAAHFYCYIAALGLTTVAHAVLFISTHPLFVIVIARFLFGEKITLWAAAGASIALSGIVVISSGSLQLADTTLPGDFLALTGAVMMTGYLLVGRSMRRNCSTLTYTFIVYGAAALILFAAAVLINIPLYPYPAADYMIFLALAVVPTIMGHSVFNWALKKFSATLVSLLFLGEPIGASILAWLFFREQPQTYFYPGALLILVGLALVVIKNTKANAPGQSLRGSLQ